MGRFTEEQLEQFFIDPHEPCSLARCPFCGADIVLGVRKGTRNLTLAHQAHKDPSDPAGLRYVSGCEPFTSMVSNPENGVLTFLRTCKSHGVHWERLVQ